MRRRTTVWVVALVLAGTGAGSAAIALASSSPPDRNLGTLVVLTPAPSPSQTPTPSPAEPLDEPADGAVDDVPADAGSTPLVPVQPAPPRNGTGAGTGTVEQPTNRVPDDGMYHPDEQYDDGMYRPSDEYNNGLWTPDAGNG